jgi:tRNA uridine 5-carboxymethylaminomethyl modification enzyme
MTILLGRYSAHLRRQESDLRLFMEDESLVLGPEINYHHIAGLSSEIKDKLSSVRPGSIVSFTLLNDSVLI